MTDDNPYHRVTQDHTANMGRIGDNDVHAAFVEFRAKESDKVCYFIRTVVLLHVLCHPNPHQYNETISYFRFHVILSSSIRPLGTLLNIK